VVLLDADDLDRIGDVARAERVSASTWARRRLLMALMLPPEQTEGMQMQTKRTARRFKPPKDVQRQLEALSERIGLSYQTVAQANLLNSIMLVHIEAARQRERR
jgi:hypothetical protein